MLICEHKYSSLFFEEFYRPNIIQKLIKHIKFFSYNEIMKNSFFKNKSFKSFLDFFSRLSISAIFISAIPGKINDFERTVEYISSKGIPEPISSILLVGAIICLILGSGFFIFGENQKIGSVFLLLFIIPTTIIFHVFPFHQRAVFMNLALIGGLIITAIREPK